MNNPCTAAASHKIVVCTECQRSKGSEKLGHFVIQQIQGILKLTEQSISNAYQVSGHACLAGCKYPCTVAFLCDKKTNYLFGDVQTDSDIVAIIAFANQYCRSESGWTRSQDRPARLRRKILARLPAPMSELEIRDGGAP